MLKSVALRLAAFRRNLMATSYNKLNHGANVTTDILEKICDALDCTMDDIMEFVSDKRE